MKKHINNPYKLNVKMYGLIGGVSLLIMVIALVYNNITGNLISDVIKNLAYGCVASSIVACLIEIGNIKEKNEKANNLYDAIFIDLRCQIMLYLETWANMCCVAYESEGYRNEKHTWIEWYEITKQDFVKCVDSRQAELIYFFRRQLMTSIDGIEKALRLINSQQYILNINRVYDEGLRKILSDYIFEFHAAKLSLDENVYDKDDFWRSFDATKDDLVIYIDNWIDIKYYNSVKFKPFGFNDDSTETLRAMLE